ncbi:MAG TPA: phosphoenolpyruvate--protein phosphotransferase [Candidatus Saccharicenans sp.]|nr:phosphoenolpyruvate--protein phosphotransferase [Candidatus Saccharicenans sp.]HPU92744.1 phosphoenolpyruvate--protein phosphotransferase [Candidatus Saccharicenans sp.]
MAVEFTFDFPLPLGLHARPAAFIQEQSQNFKGEIIFENLRNGRKAEARSILSLITSDTQFGDTCRVIISGEGEKDFAAAFQRFLEEDLKQKEERAVQAAPAGTALVPRLVLKEKEVYLTGQPASPGLASGQVFLLRAGLDEESLLADDENNSPVSIQAEKEAFLLALEEVRKGLEKQLLEKAGVERNIVQAHLSIVTDQAFRSRVEEIMEKEKCKARQAVYLAAKEFSQLLLEARSQYLRERAADIQDVARQLLDSLGGRKETASTVVLNQPAIIVAEDLFPSEFLNLRTELIKGLILEKAGQTSHTLIMARSQSIPAVTGVDQASRLLPGGEKVILDGTRGVVVISPGEKVSRYYQKEMEVERLLLQRRQEQASLPGRTADGRRVEIAANIARPEELDKAWRDGAEGVGILRTELLLYGRPTLPDEEEQFLLYKKVAEEAEGRPVIIRTFDIGGDKPIPAINLPSEPNPFLGYRGIRIYQENYELFRHQIRAILRAAFYGQLKIMFPMVSLVEEVDWLKEKLAELAGELEAEGLPFREKIETGIMLEVPSVALLADKFAAEVDFFSVGSNDLIQYFFAADRSNPKVRYLHQPLNPALLRLLAGAISRAHEAGRWVGLCGEMAGDSRLTPVFVGLGFDELSMSSGFIPEVKAVLARLKMADCQQLVEEALNSSTAAENDEHLQRFYQLHFSQDIIDEQLVNLEADSRSKAEVLQEIALRLELSGRVESRARFEQALWKREDDVATDIGFGLAIPHCQSEAVRTPSIVVLKLKQPVDWESKEDQPVDLIVSLAIPAGKKVTQQLQLLPRLSRKLIYEEFRQALRQATEAGQIIALIKEAIA